MSKKRTTKPYKASAKIAGKTYKAKGRSAIDAIANLDVGVSKGKAILQVEKGKKSKERVLPPNQASQLFNSAGLVRDVRLKNMSLLFSEL